MQGIGNDFVVLDALAHPELEGLDFAEVALEACERRRGAGGDGLLLIGAPDDTGRAEGCAVRMRMWNPDGTEDMCGNGLRCVARLAHARGYAPETFKVQTLAGTRGASVDAERVRVEMGAPLWEAEQIPLDLSRVEGGAQAYFVEMDGARVGPLCSVSTGSTHTVFFCDAGTTDKYFSSWSPRLEEHAAFPERSSILWAQVLAPAELRVRIWERGVGETLACGTGACAVAVAAMKLELIRGEAARVRSKGGVLEIGWAHQSEGPQAMIWKSGAARVVYEGRF
jgi:diaminopimelate epimerase